jgi:hypothetical protein
LLALTRLSFVQRYYLVGSNVKQTQFRVLKIDRMDPHELSVMEDPHVYEKEEMQSMLAMINDGNKGSGGLTRTATGCGIIGRSSLGALCSLTSRAHRFHQILEWLLSALHHGFSQSRQHRRPRRLLCGRHRADSNSASVAVRGQGQVAHLRAEGSAQEGQLHGDPVRD